MGNLPYVILFFTFTSLGVCGQGNNLDNKTQTNQINTSMDTSKLTNEAVKNAFDALQNNDLELWYSLFTDDAIFTDDGRTLEFKSFFDNAFEKKEKFLSIDKVENDGKHIHGNFYAGQWGTFKVFFKFHINDQGKINRLDIGQD